MAEYWNTMRLFSPSLRRFLMAMTLELTVFFGILAVLQNLFLLRLGFDTKFIGLILGLGQLVWAITALPAGYISSRLGLRNGMLLGNAVSAVALGLMLLVEALPQNMWPLWLMGSQALMMVGMAFISVCLTPYLMVVTGERERHHAFAVFQALFPATAFIGSLIGGWLPGPIATALGMTLDQAAPYGLALWAGPPLILLANWPLWKTDPGKTAVQDAQHAAGERAPIGLLLFFGVVVYLAAISQGTVRAFFNVYLDTGLAVPSAQIGTIMGVAQLLPVAAALAAPLLIARWGTDYALAGAIVGVAASLFLLAIVPTLWMVAVAYMAVIATLTVMATTRDMLSQEIVTPRWRTSISAVLMIGLSLGWSTAAMAGGYLIETLGFGALYFIGGLSSLLAAVLFAGTLRTRHSQTPQPCPQIEGALAETSL